MKKSFIILLVVSHLIVGIIGFAAGIYVLPILTAPPSPSEEKIQSMSSQAKFSGMFVKSLKDSDMFHWGEGVVSINSSSITLTGKLAPGPDYRLYLSPKFVETEKDFLQLKPGMREVGNVRTFDNFIVEMPSDIDPAQYTSVIIWCEAFKQFITAAKYR